VIRSLGGDRRVNSARRFGLAKRYCQITAGAACLQTWLHNRGAGNEFLDDSVWLEVILHRLLARMDPDTAEAADAACDHIFDHMTVQHDRGELFSLFPFQLATGARG